MAESNWGKLDVLMSDLKNPSQDFDDLRAVFQSGTRAEKLAALAAEPYGLDITAIADMYGDIELVAKPGRELTIWTW